MKLNNSCSCKETYDQSRHHIKKQRHYFANKRPSSQSFGFSSSHVWIWELDYKESWASNNWCFWTVVLEKTLESPLDCKEIQPVHPKGNQFCIFIGRTDAEAETPILWPPDVKSWLIWKDPDAGKDWRCEEKGTTEDEVVGWDHRLNGCWVWVASGSSWWTGRPGVPQSTGSKRVGHYWATELNWTDLRTLNTHNCLCSLSVDVANRRHFWHHHIDQLVFEYLINHISSDKKEIFILIKWRLFSWYVKILPNCWYALNFKNVEFIDLAHSDAEFNLCDCAPWHIWRKQMPSSCNDFANNNFNCICRFKI